MRPSPASGRSTPQSTNVPTSSRPPSKPATPANDSFANLVSFGSAANDNKNLSLLEQQKRLQEQKAKQEAERRAQFDAQYGGQNARFWDNLDRNKESSQEASAARAPKSSTDPDEDDLLAAFNASAPVDASSHFPVPISTSITSADPVTTKQDNMAFGEDDDPFGLQRMASKPRATSQPPANQDEDDDFLGLLSKPVSELPRPQDKRDAHIRNEPESAPSSNTGDPRDRAIAELVDMGFSSDKAGQALDSTESGLDMQAAVGWLLNQAHAESRQMAKGNGTVRPTESRDSRREGSGRRENAMPSWMKGEEMTKDSGNRGDSRSPASRDRDVGEMAANFGNQIFKTANSLWKTGSKKVQQAVHELNAESDPSQPRWMKEAALAQALPEIEPQLQRHGRAGRDTNRLASPMEEPNDSDDFTNEALLLESDVGRPTRHASRLKDDRTLPSERGGNRHRTPDRSALMERGEPGSSFLHQQSQHGHRSQNETVIKDSKHRLSRHVLEEQSAQAYVSPARRRRPAQQPAAAESATDLLEPAARTASKPQAPTIRSSRPLQPSTPLPSRPKAPPRKIPQVSPSALMSSHKDRESGNEYFKRGDYAAAHEAFARALSPLPNGHPVTLMVLSNRAMTALKIGEPKVAIADADTILALIGPSKGEGEDIELDNDQPSKPMRPFYGKALMRKAEALEQLERWADAAQMWKQAVESGHGSSTSIQGRNRCEKAAGISKPTSVAAARPAQPRKPTAAPKRSAFDELAGQSSQSPSATAEAVTRLRAANDAADRADEERLALTDSIDAKIAAWKGGKQDNLRALLGSLDNVLWPESGWKKINMSELVLPNKVKIQYMKGIAKVHPDKVCDNAVDLES